MPTMLIVLFLLNALSHFISYRKLRAASSPNTNGVFTFIFINLGLAFVVWQAYSWAKWPAIIFPSLGLLGLLATTILKGKGGWIDYVILLLDVATICLLLWNFFL